MLAFLFPGGFKFLTFTPKRKSNALDCIVNDRCFPNMDQ